MMDVIAKEQACIYCKKPLLEPTGSLCYHLQCHKLVEDYNRNRPYDRSALESLFTALGFIHHPIYRNYSMDWFLRHNDNLLKYKLDEHSDRAIRNNFINYHTNDLNRVTHLQVNTRRYGFKLRQLPPDLFSLEELEYLSIEVGLSSIDHLGKLSKLRILNLNNNQLVQLPSDLWTLQGLESLTLMNNNVQCMPEDIGLLENLRHIDTRGNPPQDLPESIYQLPLLESLFITGFGNESTLPNSVGSLTKLKQFKVRECFISLLPDSILNLRLLENLTLDSTYVQLLPNEIGDLQRLKSLIINHSLLNSLPKSVANMQELEFLMLRGGRFQDVPPEVWKLKKLKALFLDYNAIKTIPPEIQNLEDLRVLTLNNTNLTALPKELLELPKLRYVNISNTPVNHTTGFKKRGVHVERVIPRYWTRQLLDRHCSW